LKASKEPFVKSLFQRVTPPTEFTDSVLAGPASEFLQPALPRLNSALVRDAVGITTEPRLNWLAKKLNSTVDDLLPNASTYFRMRALDIKALRAIEPDFAITPFAECQRRGCLVGRAFQNAPLTVVVSDPIDHRLRQWLDARMRLAGVASSDFALTTPADLQAVLAIAEKSMRAMDTLRTDNGETFDMPIDNSALSLSISNIDATDSQVVRLVDSTLLDALRTGASDIHLETQPNGLHIKYRIDGVLEVIKTIDNIEIAHQAISRIKVVSELDIAERRIPQDGRFKVTTDGREIDFRVSIMPNLFGEDAVLRVLDRQHLTGQMRSLRLESLGFQAEVKAFIRHAAEMPYGLLLVTGPTGSGKTTTLYAAISEINTGLDKIITIEDPIEYQLPGVLQIPVNEKKGLTFARGLRSILRHDPDKIMVGEIRDAETAHIAVQAALTGHQVFTTVHANNVFDVIGRFANMGVDSYSLVAALNGIVAQRLVRLSCTQCAEPVTPTDELLTRSGLTGARAGLLHTAVFKRGIGCSHCRGSGYKGREAIAETLPMDDALREALVQRVPLPQIKQNARAQGFQSLRDAAVNLALKGRTTLEEINRVTPVE
jgi:general secretion pathway protein E